MAIKGNAYTKTTWAFEERPVASSKLNLWDDRIESGLELMHFFLAQTSGGVDGVLRGVTADDLDVQASSPVSLSVEAQPGYASISDFPYHLSAVTSSGDLVAPTTDDRIDLVQARLGTWDISVKTGTEAPSPSAPSPDADAIALAELYLRPAMTSIKDADDATNGYIVDVRDFL